jgi:AcrR family transcriptional regulator
MAVEMAVRPSPTALAPQEERVIDAGLRCIGRWGTAKTTLDDVAREAGCSRATIYRLFPGGKEALLQTIARTEVARFFDALADRLTAAPTLEESLTLGITEAGRRIESHQALQFLFAYEPETIVPHLAFTRAGDVLAYVASFAAPYLSRWLPPEDARRAAEWAGRIVLSFCNCPSPEVDLSDETSIRRLVETFLMPGLTPLMIATRDERGIPSQ